MWANAVGIIMPIDLLNIEFSQTLSFLKNNLNICESKQSEAQ